MAEQSTWAAVRFLQKQAQQAAARAAQVAAVDAVSGLDPVVVNDPVNPPEGPTTDEALFALLTVLLSQGSAALKVAIAEDDTLTAWMAERDDDGPPIDAA